MIATIKNGLNPVRSTTTGDIMAATLAKLRNGIMANVALLLFIICYESLNLSLERTALFSLYF